MGDIKDPEREAALLFPEALDDDISPENAVRFVEAFERSLNLAQLGCFSWAAALKRGVRRI